MQVLALLVRSRIPWPAEIKSIMRVFSIFNFSIDIAAPECINPNFGYEKKWLLVQIMPVVVIGILLVTHWVLIGYKRGILHRPRDKVRRHVPTMVASGFTLMYFMYLSLCRQALSVFACVKSDPDDGQAPYGYLQADVTIKCYQGGHNLLWPLALVSIGVYVIGYPLAIARVLTQNAIPIQSDIILLAMNAGDDRASNPGAYAIRKMFKRLYYQMRYEKFYWVLLVLARKASIAGVALFLR